MKLYDSWSQCDINYVAQLKLLYVPLNVYINE